MNELPLSLVLSWYEQKPRHPPHLLSLGLKDIRSGDAAGLLHPPVAQFIVVTFDSSPSHAEGTCRPSLPEAPPRRSGPARAAVRSGRGGSQASLGRPRRRTGAPVFTVMHTSAAGRYMTILVSGFTPLSPAPGPLSVWGLSASTLVRPLMVLTATLSSLLSVEDGRFEQRRQAVDDRLQ